MRRIVMSGWNIGFKKVSLTVLLRQRICGSLAQAKTITDAVLANQSVSIEIPEDQFEEVVAELNDIGVRFTEG